VEQWGELGDLGFERGWEWAVRWGWGGVWGFLGMADEGVAEGGDSLAGTGDHGEDGDAESGGEVSGVDVMAVLACDVGHVQGDEGGVTEFDDLGGVVEVTFEIGSVDDDDDGVGWGDVALTVEEDIPGDSLIFGLSAEAVGSREVQEGDGEVGRGAADSAFFAFDGDAGVITDAGAEAGQGVEEGCFAAVGVAGEGNPVGMAG
jgi:hypothetical protein